MAFPPIDVLGVVSPALLTASRGIHGLAIYAGGGARGVRLLLSADPLAEQVVDGVQGAVVPPLIEVPPHSRLGREVLGEVTPLAAGTQDVEDGIDYVAQVGLAWSAAGVDGQLRLDQKPLRVGYVAGVGLCSHESFYASSPPLMGQSLSPYCLRRYGVSAHRRSWRCLARAAHRLPWYPRTGYLRWRWCEGSKASPECGPSCGAGRGWRPGCRCAATHRSTATQ